MPLTTYELSIEEVAYAMGVEGGTEVAAGFLMALLGERPRLEIEGRLLAASHALVARGYLDFDPDTGRKWLENGLEEIVSVMLHNDFSIRCSRAESNSETVLSLYVSGDKVIVHRLLRQVTSRLEQVPDAESAREQCLEFFGLPENSPAPEKPVATFPADLIDQMQQGKEFTSELFEHGVPQDMAEKLSEDIAHQKSRGSVIKIVKEEGKPVSNQGFLTLQSPERAWIMDIIASTPPKVNLYPGSAEAFRKLFSTLVT